MNNKQLTIKRPFVFTTLLFIIYCLLFIGARSAHASSVYLETTRTEFFVGDTILINVKVDSDSKEINIVEGKVSLDYLPDTISVRDINLSESSFSLWPNKPLLSEDLRTITFVGGVQSGIKRQNATLFKIVLSLKNVGQVTLRPADISVYLNDGKGTKDGVNIQGLTINVLPQEIGHKPVNDLNTLLSQDRTPPKSFEIILGQDDSVFDGKKFLSFSTVDDQSGIKYYEVIEGDLSPMRSNGTYVLVNQDKPTKVRVIAYDAAGNSRESAYEPKSYLRFIVITVLALLLLIALRFVLKRRKKNDSI